VTQRTEWQYKAHLMNIKKCEGIAILTMYTIHDIRNMLKRIYLLDQKNEMSKNRNNRTSVDHLFASSRGGNSSECNLLTVRDTIHRAKHTLFENMTIDESILHYLQYHEKALNPKILIDITNYIQSIPTEERYKQEVMKY
jgi:hypothetical protein